MKSFKRAISLVLVFAMMASCFCFSQTTTAASKAKLKKKTATIYVKKTTTIQIKNKNKKCNYTFTNKNKKIVKVTSKGKVTGLKAGTAKIVVKQVWKKKYNKNKKKKTTTVGTFTVKVKKKTTTTTPTVTPEPVIKMSQTAIDRSLVNLGNTVRMKKAIAKAQSGQTVRIAYIGGSITEGAGATTTQKCYAYKSYLIFKQLYGKGDGSNVKFVNAGMSGTPSSVGLVRYQRDVVQMGGGEPDILFVEFAVNDADDTTDGLAYESLVRTAMNDSQKTAVVLLFSVFKSQWNLQDRLEPVGNLYNLPMISIKDALVPEINNKTVTNDEYFSDAFHPTDAGHTVMANCIKNYFTKVAAAKTDASDIVVASGTAISNAIGTGSMYENLKMIDSATTGYTIDKGSFTDVDENLCSFSYDSKRKNFPNNWMYCGDEHQTGELKSFKITVTGKSALLLYKIQSMQSLGAKADVYVDGTFKRTICGYNSGGFGNPYTACVFNTGVNGTHTIEVKIQETSRDADLTIMALGVAQ